jgi:hypothetical protein
MLSIDGLLFAPACAPRLGKLPSIGEAYGRTLTR